MVERDMDGEKASSPKRVRWFPAQSAKPSRQSHAKRGKIRGLELDRVKPGKDVQMLGRVSSALSMLSEGDLCLNLQFF
jgi:hypothetical protein